MNDKITLARLASELSGVTGCSAETAEQFLKVVIDDFSHTISKGGSVLIPGIGELKADASTHDVKWIIDEDLASSVNEPFSAFEPVELESGVTEEILDGDSDAIISSDSVFEEVDVTTEKVEEPEEPEISEDSEASSSIEDVQFGSVEDLEKESEPKEDISQMEIPKLEEKEVVETAKDNNLVSEEIILPEYRRDKKRNPLLPWIFFLVGLVAGLTIGYIAGLCCHSSDSNNVIDAVEIDVPAVPIGAVSDTVQVDSTLVNETVDSIPNNSATKSENEIEQLPVVMDTVTASRYLTTLSRKYFGDFRFWIYIYEENKGKIDNPDRIKPGTVVVIPEKEKYGINSSDPESVKKAETLIREYYDKK